MFVIVVVHERQFVLFAYYVTRVQIHIQSICKPYARPSAFSSLLLQNKGQQFTFSKTTTKEYFQIQLYVCKCRWNVFEYISNKKVFAQESGSMCVSFEDIWVIQLKNSIHIDVKITCKVCLEEKLTIFSSNQISLQEPLN